MKAYRVYLAKDESRPLWAVLPPTLAGSGGLGRLTSGLASVIVWVISIITSPPDPPSRQEGGKPQNQVINLVFGFGERKSECARLARAPQLWQAPL